MTPRSGDVLDEGPIPRRRVAFAFDAATAPRDFYAGDPVLSSLMAALSLLFPEGERFFVESVVHFEDRIDDPDLARTIRDFAAQEGMHSKAHVAFNALVEAQGHRVVAELERGVRRLLRRGRRVHSPEGRLAVTCALEHFTAILAEQLLGDERHRAALDAAVRDLWLWHALEETEHKAVAFDVYRRVDGSWSRRARVMLLTTVMFVGFASYCHARLLAERGLLGDVRGLVRATSYLWIRPGLFRKLVPAYLDYFRPGFHPHDRDSSALVAAWRERLFGPAGTLRRAGVHASRSATG